MENYFLIFLGVQGNPVLVKIRVLKRMNGTILLLLEIILDRLLYILMEKKWGGVMPQT